MSLAPGTTIGSFRLDAVVGRGFSTTTYRGHDIESGAVVLIEILDQGGAGETSMELLGLDHGGDREPSLHRRFVDRSEAMLGVGRPGLPSVLDVARTDDGLPYVVTSPVEGPTLADRLEDPTRITSDRDLHRLTGFLAETLATIHASGLVHRRVRPETIICHRPVAPTNDRLIDRPDFDEPDGIGDSSDGGDHGEGTPPPAAGTTLIDTADELVLTLPDVIPESRAAVAGRWSSHDSAPETDLADVTVDQRADVYSASATLAEAAVGRFRNPDESWERFVEGMDADLRPSLASALWVGLADVAAIRYRTIAQWRRSIEAALRSDAATAAMAISAPQPKSKRGRIAGPLVGAVVAMAAVLGVMMLAQVGPFSSDQTESAEAGDDGSAPTSAPAGPTAAEGSVQGVEGSDRGTGSETAEASGDLCQFEGPLGPLSVDDVTDRSIVIGWTPATNSVNIQLDGAFLDTVPPDTNQYVIEHRPLLPPPLAPDTTFRVEIHVDGEEASSVCATTTAEPPTDQQAGNPTPIGVYAPTGLRVLDVTPTSITVIWDARPGADYHNLFLDGIYVQFGDVGGSTAIGDETEFTFLGLEPGTTYDIGVRRIEGFNQSGLVSVTATTAG